MAKLNTLALAAVIATSLAGQAFGADILRPPGQPALGAPEQSQEWGTGWYLRGDIGVSREQVPSFFPGGLPGYDGKTLTMGSVSIGPGYKFNNWFRLDMTYEYRQRLKNTVNSANFDCPIEIRGLDNLAGDPVGIYAVNNQCQARQSAKLTRQALLLNAYFDLGTWAGVTPYIGAGVGASHGKMRASYDWINQADGSHYGPNLVIPGGYPIVWMDAFGNLVPPGTANFGVQDHRAFLNKSRINLAWAAMAGFSLDVSANAKIDFGYRYMSMGKFGAEKARGNHEMRIGMRYMVD